MDKDFLIKVIENFGIENQITQAIQELSELIKAITDYKLGRGETNIIEEIADVKIMVTQLELIFANKNSGEIEKMVDFKINRLKERIKNELI